MDIYDELPPYIQEYLYRKGWIEFRKIQEKAYIEIKKGQKNVVLTAGTASGKTEAAFLPILTDLYNRSSKSISVIYISPLKALVNDQFVRLEEMLEKGNVTLHKWHGDVAQNKKNELLKKPTGILQITVESLEMILSCHYLKVRELFSDLRFVVIDEMHYFMDSPRGIQLLCILERLQRSIEKRPIRIGLSATLGDMKIASQWIETGTGRKSVIIQDDAQKRKIGVVLKYFQRKDDETGFFDENVYRYIYNNTYGLKSIIFANSRNSVEDIIIHLKKYATTMGDSDIYQVHHGNISSSLREEIESKMKKNSDTLSIGATVTLELGIDIGKLDRIIQVGAPWTISSLAQRLGRCGRRGQRAEMIYVLNGSVTDIIDWELLRGIACLELYLKEKWIEPIRIKKKPFTILYHQTMAELKIHEQAANVLASKILTLSSFKDITQNEYKLLLSFLIEIGHIEKNDIGNLRLAEKGEHLTNSYKFCAVFEQVTEYKVKFNQVLIGTIDREVEIGDCFVLAGKAWRCIEFYKKSKEIHVIEDKGGTTFNWDGKTAFSIHTRVMQKMKNILLSDEMYRYLDVSAQNKLNDMRRVFKGVDIECKKIISVDNNLSVVIPWIGTAQLETLYYALKSKGYEVEEKQYYLMLKTDSKRNLENDIDDITSGNMDKYSFVYPKGIMIKNRYAEYIPEELLRKEYIEDWIDYEGLINDWNL